MINDRSNDGFQVVIFTFSLHLPEMKVSFSMFFNSQNKTFTSHVILAAPFGGATSTAANNVVCLPTLM